MIILELSYLLSWFTSSTKQRERLKWALPVICQNKGAYFGRFRLSVKINFCAPIGLVLVLERKGQKGAPISGASGHLLTN